MDQTQPGEQRVASRTLANRIYCADSRDLDMIEDGVVDLVICSPPYNVGKNYRNHDDALPLEEYLALLRDVWKECRRVMRPGGAGKYGRANGAQRSNCCDGGERSRGSSAQASRDSHTGGRRNDGQFRVLCR